jgi:hypothetical protein
MNARGALPFCRELPARNKSAGSFHFRGFLSIGCIGLNRDARGCGRRRADRADTAAWRIRIEGVCVVGRVALRDATFTPCLPLFKVTSVFSWSLMSSTEKG